MAFVFDTGVLIAADRGDRRFWQLRDEMEHAEISAIVPVVVLTEAWRGERNANLARALRGFDLEVIDAELALRAGVLCGQTRTDDPVDAIVVASAARRGNAIVTTDARDLRRLAESAPGCGPVLDLNDL